MGHYAHDSHGEAIDVDRPTDDAPISAETPLPVSVSEDEHGRTPGAVVVGKKKPTQLGLHPKNVEQARTHHCRPRAFGGAAGGVAAHCELGILIYADVVESSAVRLEVERLVCGHPP